GLGDGGQHLSSDTVRADESGDTGRAGFHRALHGKYGRSGIAVRTCDDAEYAARVLVGDSRWDRPPRSEVIRAEAPHGWAGLELREADADELQLSGSMSTRWQQQAALPRAECHRQVGTHVGTMNFAGVRINPARQVDGDHRCSG